MHKFQTQGNDLADKVVVGASVATADGRELGHVKQVEASAFLIDVPLHFDYWLEVNLVKEASAERVVLAIAESDLGGYKMDRPYDHNEFKAAVPDRLQTATMRDSLLGL
jgi:hypothetical protein